MSRSYKSYRQWLQNTNCLETKPARKMLQIIRPLSWVCLDLYLGLDPGISQALIGRAPRRFNEVKNGKRFNAIIKSGLAGWPQITVAGITNPVRLAPRIIQRGYQVFIQTRCLLKAFLPHQSLTPVFYGRISAASAKTTASSAKSRSVILTLQNDTPEPKLPDSQQIYSPRGAVGAKTSRSHLRINWKVFENGAITPQSVSNSQFLHVGRISVGELWW